jgi:four helix bundle protein
MDRRELEARTAALATALFSLANATRGKPGGRLPADQLLDCATAVGANYRASARARSRAEFIAKLGVVNEEADEVVYWLEFFRSARLAEAPHLEDLLREAKELRAIFAASCRTAKRNHRRRSEGRS